MLDGDERHPQTKGYRAPAWIPPRRKGPALLDLRKVELAGLEPATSWVRSRVVGISGASTGQGSPVVRGASASPRTMTVCSCEHACTRLVPARHSEAPFVAFVLCLRSLS